MKNIFERKTYIMPDKPKDTSHRSKKNDSSKKEASLKLPTPDNGKLKSPIEKK